MNSTNKIIRYSTKIAIDFSELENLVNQMPNICLYGDELQTYLDKLEAYGELFTILEKDKPRALLGFYANDFKTKIAYLSCIVVSSKLLGQGVGQELFSKMCLIAKSNGMTNLRLDVEKTNQRAISFYEKNKCMIIQEGRNSNYWLMEKSLDDV